MSGGSKGGSPVGAIFGGFFDGMSTAKNIEGQINYLHDLEDTYNNDAAYQKQVGARKLSLMDTEQFHFNDKFKSSLGRSGISFEGSAVDVFNQNKVQQQRENAAVKLDTDTRVNEAYRKAASARSQRYDQEDSAPLEVLGSFLGGGAKGYQQWGGK